MIWDARTAEAKECHLPTRPIAALERRLLENVSTGFARCLHRAIYMRTTCRYSEAQPQPEDEVMGDPHHPADP